MVCQYTINYSSTSQLQVPGAILRGYSPQPGIILFLGVGRGKDFTFALREILKSVQQIHRQEEMQTTLKANVSVIMVQVGGNFVI